MSLYYGNISQTVHLFQELGNTKTPVGVDPSRTQYTQCQPYFLAMLSIFSFFFMRGREVVETEVSTREEVDCDTWENLE